MGPGQLFKDVGTRGPVFAVAVNVDSVSEHCIPVLTGANADHGLRSTIFAMHQSRILAALAASGAAELAIHPDFLSGSTHGNNARGRRPPHHAARVGGTRQPLHGCSMSAPIIRAPGLLALLWSRSA